MKNKNRKSKTVATPLRAYRADDWDLAEMQRKADRHAEGNLSAWIRHAARMYTPKKGEKIVQRAS